MTRLLSRAVGCSLLLSVISTGAAHAAPLPPPSGYDSALQAMPIVLSNVTGERPDSDIWVSLVGGGLPTDPNDVKVINPSASVGYYYDASGVGQALYTNTSLNLTGITGNSPGAKPTLYIYGWASGRLYMSYGSELAGLSESYTPSGGPYNGWQPAPAPEGLDPNFMVRHQSMELSVIPQRDQGAFTSVNEIWSNTTYIDYTAISLGMQAHHSNASHPTQWSRTTQEMVNAVAINNLPEPYTPNTNVLTQGYYKQEGEGYLYSPTPQEGYQPIVQLPGEEASSNPNRYRNPVNFLPPDGPLPSSNFLRVTGPGLIGTLGSASGPTAVYHNWSNYLAALEHGGKLNEDGSLVNRMAGTFGQVGGNLDYSLDAKFYDGEVVLNDSSTYTGYVELKGEIDGVEVSIIIPYVELQKSEGIYGANPHYSIDHEALQAPGNTVYTWIVGDLLTGLNLGLLGSEVVVSYDGLTQAIGAYDSSDWWKIAVLNGGQYQFDGAQPHDGDFYNPYSAALRHVTSGYNFAYTDRLGDSLTSFILNPLGSPDYANAYLEILIQPDFQAIPEPGTVAALSFGAGLLWLARRRRTKAV